MIRRPPRSKRTDALFPYTTLFRSDWMSRYFFTGGTMPSEHLFAHFQDDLKLVEQWWVNGQHYERTSNHWLRSEEHTSELQSLMRISYAVFCLKKKKTTTSTPEERL